MTTDLKSILLLIHTQQGKEFSSSLEVTGVFNQATPTVCLLYVSIFKLVPLETKYFH